MSVNQSLRRAWQRVPIALLAAPACYLLLVTLVFLNIPEDPAAPSFVARAAWLCTGLALTLALAAMKRWAGIGFVLLTAAGLLIRYALPATHPLSDAAKAAFPVDIIICLFILIFYKNLR